VTRTLTLVAALALGIATLARARHDPGGSFGGASTTGALAEFAGGWSLVAAGLLLSTRRRTAVAALLVAAGLLWFAREWSNPAIGSAFAFTAGNVLFAACVPFVAHAALAYPSGRLRTRGAVAAVTAAYVGAVVLLGVLPTAVFDPPRVGCAACPRNLLLLHSDADLYGTLNRWGLRLALVWIAALVVAAASRRAHSAPVLVAATAYLVVFGWEVAHALPVGVLGNDATAVRIWQLEALCLVALFGGVVWSIRRERHARAEVARLVLELAGTPRPGGLERVLREELGDASLTLAYRRTDPEAYVDGTGAPVTVAVLPGQVVTPLRREEAEVGVIVHDARLLEQPGLVREAVAAAQLALANEQLQAEVRAQLTELQQSRARIVAAGDATRQRLERDLHDGAQQRLVGLLIALRLLRAEHAAVADPAAATVLDAVGASVDEALDALREIAHGLYPTVLADDGLKAALEMARERSPDRVRIAATVGGRFPRPVENAAYFAATEAAAEAAAVTISAVRPLDELVVEIDRGGSPALDAGTMQEIADRVGAVGGRVSSAGSIVRAEIPCAS
jgi:signal transduction histidine kinase